MPQTENSKIWYKSKTIWTNLILGVGAIFIPNIEEVFTPDVIASIFVVFNVLLRAMTSKEIYIK